MLFCGDHIICLYKIIISANNPIFQLCQVKPRKKTIIKLKSRLIKEKKRKKERW